MKNIITISNGVLHVPDSPVIPYIEGDGIGPDVWKATQNVLDSAVNKAYSGKKSINWLEVFAGEKSFNLMNSWLPTETIDAFKLFKIGMKGPLTTPVGGGIRSLNVALRQTLDLNYEKLMAEKGKDAAEKEKAQAMQEGKILIWDSIMDNTLQQVLTNPKDFDVIATLNLNGDYLSDAIAAQATHGTAPTFANKDMANPSSLILSGVMMLDYLGWGEAADLVEEGLKKTILSKKVTFDLARDMEGAKEDKTPTTDTPVTSPMDVAAPEDALKENTDAKNDGKLYGEAPKSTATAIAFADLMAAPEKYDGMEVVVKGNVNDVCQAEGCWIILGDGNKEITVKTLHVFVVPKDSYDNLAEVNGVFKIKEITEEQARHMNSESKNTKIKTEDIKGPQKVYTITATGIKLAKGDGKSGAEQKDDSCCDKSKSKTECKDKKD
ncbi:unnamed protein product [Rotaria sp. Silwood1]|nr:unnamed protein product [Rotaria sp. Silwood1]